MWIATQWTRIAVAILFFAIAVAALGSVPQTRLTVEVGTEGGLFHAMAQVLAADLESHGVTVDIVHRADSMNIPDDIGDIASGVDGGFISSVVPAHVSDSLRQVGSVMFAPVYLVTTERSTVGSVPDIRGRTIGLYPRESAAWAACDFVLRNYGIDVDQENASYGNGITILDGVIDGETEVACLIDVPAGSTIIYAGDSLARFSSPELRLLPIPESTAISNKRDFLVSAVVEAGSFGIFPDVTPAEDIETNAGVITFVGREGLAPELVTLVAQSLQKTYSHGTSVNEPGLLPSVDFSTLASFDEARSVYDNGLPWLYQNFSFSVAGFLDKFLSTYGLFLTTLLVVLSITDNIGFAKPLHFVKKSQPARLKLVLEYLALRAESSKGLSAQDKKRLARVEQWVRDEKPSMTQIESLIDRVKKSSAFKK
ncbi:MAG: hypothetical protein RL107_144 [Actinomycetota bacterium]|jgi:hypothetical protein